MTDVFISYKRRARPQVERVAAALRAEGLDVWFDAALEAGSSFSAEISAQVRGARCILVCWTGDAFPHGGDRNGWVLGEAQIGRERGVLVPVMLERCPLDPPWNTLHTEDLTGWLAKPGGDDAAWRGVLAAIGRHVGRPDLASRVSLAGESRPAAPERAPPAWLARPLPQLVLLAVALAGGLGTVASVLGAFVPGFGGIGPWFVVTIACWASALVLVPLVLALRGVVPPVRAGILALGPALASLAAGMLGYVVMNALFPSTGWLMLPSAPTLAATFLLPVAGMALLTPFAYWRLVPGLSGVLRRRWLVMAALGLLLVPAAAFMAGLAMFGAADSRWALLAFGAAWLGCFAALLATAFRQFEARPARIM